VDKGVKKDVKLEIVVNDQVADGQYVNLAVVNHNDSEFVVDCIFVQPQASKAKVKSRLIMAPRHAKRLMLALAQNIKAYEDNYGTINLDERPGSDVVDPPIH
jgi:hypothetical protein